MVQIMATPIGPSNYISEIKDLKKALDLYTASDTEGSPKKKMLKLDPSISLDNGNKPSFEELKSKFQKTLDFNQINHLSNVDKDKAIKTLEKIKAKVNTIIASSPGDKEIKTLDHYQQNISEFLARNKNQADINKFFIDSRPEQDSEIVISGIDCFIRRSTDKKNYTLVFREGNNINKIGLALTAAGIQARELKGEFPSLEAIFKTKKLAPKPILKKETEKTPEKKTTSSSSSSEIYKSIQNKTGDYLKYKKVQFAYRNNSKYDRQDEEFLVPMYLAPVNRFTDVPSVVNTMVKVEIRGKDNYLHANHIHMENFDSKFIVGHAPTYGSEHLFWASVLNHGSDIIDLTTTADDLSFNGNKYIVYPDAKGKKTEFHPISVILTETKEMNDGIPYIEYTYQVKNEDTGLEKTVTRYHFNQWIDHSAITPEKLEHIVDRFTDSSKEQFVHCRAGIGRSGTFVVAAYLKEGIEKGLITRNNFVEILEKLVLDGRTQRSRGFVEKSVQFDLLYNFGEMLLARK